MKPGALRGVDTSSDLIYAIEDVFHLKFTQSELNPIVTVGELNDLVLKKFGSDGDYGCLTQIAFYRVRQALMSGCGVRREMVTLDRQLENLLPEENRRKLWSELRKNLGFNLPDLLLPPNVTRTFFQIFCVGVAMIVAGVAFQPLRALPAIAAAMWLVLFIAHQVISSTAVANVIPRDFQTVRGMVDQVITWNYGYLSHLTGKHNEKQLRAVLSNLIAYVCEIKPEEVVPELRFVDIPDFFD